MVDCENDSKYQQMMIRTSVQKHHKAWRELKKKNYTNRFEQQNDFWKQQQKQGMEFGDLSLEVMYCHNPRLGAANISRQTIHVRSCKMCAFSDDFTFAAAKKEGSRL